jgi:hypothetical protein
MKRIKFLVALITLIIMGAYWALSTGAWVEKEPYSIREDILTIVLAGSRDSTSVWPCDREVTIAILPGKTSTTPDSFAASRDSVKACIIARGWAGKNREHCLGQVCLWSPWNVSGGSRSDGSNADSMYTVLDFQKKTLYALRSTGTGDWDSSRYELNDLKNLQSPYMWPYIDIAVYDSSGHLAGKNTSYKVRYIGYSGNVTP